MPAHAIQSPEGKAESGTAIAQLPQSTEVLFKVTHARGGFPAALHFTSLAVLAGTIVLPQLLLATYALISPEIRQHILAEPLVSFQLSMAILFWMGIFLWPLKRLFTTLSSMQMIEIRDLGANTASVAVTEHHLLGDERHWSEPLSSFDGLTRKIRASLSGLHHELVLVHQNPARSLMLMSSINASDPEFAILSRKLGLPDIPSPTEYHRNQTRSSPLPVTATILRPA